MQKPTVIKIGGSLLRDAPAWIRVLESVLTDKNPIVIVVSAAYGVTDRLLKMIANATRGHIDHAVSELNRFHDEHERLAHHLLGTTRTYRNFLKGLLTLEQRILEYLHLMARTPLVTGALRHPVLAAGEQLAARLTAGYLNVRHRPAVVIDPRHLLIAHPQPGSRLQFHIPDDAIRSRILDPLENGTTPVIPGFYARTLGGRIITLGRGGSDLSAALFAATLKAAELQIWTDVPGLRTGDPEVIATTRPVPTLPYELARIVARMGVKRFHPEALEPVAREKIPIRITSPAALKHGETLIASDIRAESGPLLIAHVAPVIHFRFTWPTLPPTTIGEFLNDLHHFVQPDFIAFAERPPCVHGYLITHTPSSRRVLNHLAGRSHANLQIDDGAMVGIVGLDLAPESVMSVLKHHPRVLLLPWVTDTFIPLWTPRSNVKSLIQDLHRCLFESPPNGPPNDAPCKPQPRSQNAQKHSKMLLPFHDCLQVPFDRSGSAGPWRSAESSHGTVRRRTR